MKELQWNAAQTEIYRVVAQRIKLYNTEHQVQELFPGYQMISKLVGTHNKRVVVQSIPEMKELAVAGKTDVSTNVGKQPQSAPIVIDWDRNWGWDF